MNPYQGFNRPPVEILPAPSGSATAGTGSGDAPRRKRTRAKRSCDMCRKKKSKCDAEVNQPCSNCKNWKTECVFLVEQKKRGPSTGYVELLETRLKRMESLIENLARTNGKPDSLDESVAEVTPPPSTDDTSNTSQVSIGDSYDSQTERMESISESPKQTSESDKTERPADMDEQMKGLQIEDYGSMCYMGSSSGIHLIERHFLKGQKVRFPGEKVTYVQKVNDDDAENIIVKTEVYTAEDIEATLHQPEANEEDDDNLFQHKNLTDKLVNVFFEKIYVYSPFINKDQFLHAYHSDCPGNPDEYLLAAICGVGARFLPEEIAYTKRRADGTGDDVICRKSEDVGTFFQLKAHSVLDIASKRSRISTLQTLLLITMYFDNEHSSEDNSMRWFVAGVAIRMAQDLGLHRSATRWNIPKAEIELRRRLWYATYVMDRWVSAELGRPVTILDHDFDVEVPSLYEIEPQALPCTPQSASSSSVTESPKSELQHPIYSTFIHFIKLTQILGQVLQGLHSPRARSLNRRNESLVCFLDGALVRWKLNLPVDLEFNSSMPASPYRGSVQMCYNLVLLLLHRPASTDTIEKSRTAFQSLSICTNAANNILCIAESLTVDDFLRSPWNITVYTLVQACLIFLHHAKGDNPQLKQCGFNSLLRCVRLFKRKEFRVGTNQTQRVLHLLMALIAMALDRCEVASHMLALQDDEVTLRFAEEVDNMVILPSSCISDLTIGKERSKRAAAVAPFAQSKRPRPIPLKQDSLMEMLNASESADSTLFNSPNNFGSLLYPSVQQQPGAVRATGGEGLEQAAIMTAPSESVLFGGTGLDIDDSFSLMEGLLTPNSPSPNPQNQSEGVVGSTVLMDRQGQLPNYAYMSELHAPEDDTQRPQDIIQQLFQNSRLQGANGDTSNDPTLSLLNSEIALWEAPSSMTWNDWDQYVSSMASSQQPDLSVTSL